MDTGLLLLDTPGILWPKLGDEEVGRRLAYTGAVKDNVLDTETLALHLMKLLYTRYPETLRERYKLDCPPETDGFALLSEAARKRGFLLARGELDTERMARILWRNSAPERSENSRWSFQKGTEETTHV